MIAKMPDMVIMVLGITYLQCLSRVRRMRRRTAGSAIAVCYGLSGPMERHYCNIDLSQRVCSMRCERSIW